MSNGRGNLEATNLLAGARRGFSALVVSTIFFLLALYVIGFCEITMAQRRSPRRPIRSAPPEKTQSIDYSRFSHATNKHQAACNTCHKVPSREWQKARDFPDIADYPDHNACVGCHRRQFFKGPRPVICTICHTKVSPRDDARFAFRNPISRRQFTIEFPHDKHQDVIALLRRAVEAEKPVGFVPAIFDTSSRAVDDQAKAYNNCTICHASGTKQPVAAPGGWVDSFIPDAAAFKSVPLSHASCFNCHWKAQPPLNSDCAGCHKLAAERLADAQPAPGAGVPIRISMKFRHAREQHVAECTTCHINITRASTLRGLTPDVPITSCTECHNKDGLRLDVSSELAQVDKNPGFVCVYCHTSNIGRLDAPASHFLIAGLKPAKRSATR